ncbi:glutamyl-tRNA(Gln) amidotransferase subunit B, mitochondrial [Hylaeus volcanicus]|uniref:glutamyl-tRNA(Gln) amidotransferase subunit B, mitochondrial n=1 Tax=Hylaeus volcanicus TaxID=313075 RepID=UPI0023B83F1E|nr:glutamyl-tRNA(Gln) amidotransferase subunit B, mitochondrial [Hylaeus volcanicus]XP_053971032.1 glutamyl-tRNA(Gln) amidotransferase subunit B, mitochondrial [Hylaeus volcanicus]XP_053971033.1 glutamyl-tRNA(Gln) amidotransferase subunit B, mitochondrial [Hylaeus volcanicus]
MLLRKRECIFVKKFYNNIQNWYQLRHTSTNLSEWKPTIGLEIHAQIATKSKLFSGASTNFQSPINSCVSLFDCAMPGTMPVLNKKCVEAGVLTALALSCKVNDVSMFERKHYFYPDLPAGYQITQHKNPLAVNGEIEFMVFNPGVHKKPYMKSSKLKQIQLEQDSGRSFHFEDIGKNLIDLNRAGIPLIELVFEPDLSDGEEAAALVKELCLILQMLETCSCKMEEGSLRVDANVSISKHNAPLGTRTELKNIGSTRAVSNAIDYEIRRQISILEAGGKITNETRAWDPAHKKTILMREKEDNHDYRFMPEPNLLPLRLHVNESIENKYNLIDVSSLKKYLPELPGQIREKMMKDLCVTPNLTIAIMSDLELLNLYLDILKGGKDRNAQTVAQILMSEVLAFLNRHKLELKFCTNNRHYIEEIIDLFQAKVINFIIIRKLLDKWPSELEKMPTQIIRENDWYSISDQKELEKICLETLEKYPKLVKKYKAGNTKVYKKILHEVVKITNERADMAEATKILTRLLS